MSDGFIALFCLGWLFGVVTTLIVFAINGGDNGD